MRHLFSEIVLALVFLTLAPRALWSQTMAGQPDPTGFAADYWHSTQGSGPWWDPSSQVNKKLPGGGEYTAYPYYFIFIRQGECPGTWDVIFDGAFGFLLTGQGEDLGNTSKEMKKTAETSATGLMLNGMQVAMSNELGANAMNEQFQKWNDPHADKAKVARDTWEEFLQEAELCPAACQLVENDPTPPELVTEPSTVLWVPGDVTWALVEVRRSGSCIVTPPAPPLPPIMPKPSYQLTEGPQSRPKRP